MPSSSGRRILLDSGPAALLAGTARAERPGNTRTAEWQPVRMLRAGSFRVALDDTDPYRDCHHGRPRRG